MNLLDPKLDAYVCEHTATESPVLQQLNRETYSRVLMPRMLSGQFQGRLLSMLSHMIRPKRILEIGTYTGYSAICLSEGLVEGGLLFTIDINEELETMVRKYLALAGLEKKIDYRIGDARKVIPTMEENFDLVFIDADKDNYCIYYDLIFDKVRPGGYIIADNVLWSGKVIEELVPGDFDTKALLDFNAKVSSDPRVEAVLLPVRDGLMVLRKKELSQFE